MRKHLLGLAIFGFIFASFALTFAFFYAPQIPQVAEVKENYVVARPTVNYEKTSCFRNKRKNISVSIINSQYFLESNKIMSEVKLVWNGSGVPPEKVYLTTIISGSEQNNGNAIDGVYQILEEPFKNANEKTFTVISRSAGSIKNKRQDNLYVTTAVAEHSGGEADELNKNFSEAKEVVFVHGESSVIGK